MIIVVGTILDDFVDALLECEGFQVPGDAVGFSTSTIAVTSDPDLFQLITGALQE